MAYFKTDIVYKIVLYVSLLLILVIVAGFLYGKIIKKAQDPYIGVTFSPKYAKELHLEAQGTYLSMLKDLKPKTVRLMAYWDEIEPEKDHFQYDNLNFYVNEASKQNTPVILSVGYKLPRWPECHIPGWVDTQNPSLFEERVLKMVENVVKTYDQNPDINLWQVENEPQVSWFGHCPKPNPELLKKEVGLVRNLSQKPVMITDSGEFGLWAEPMKLSDTFGTTLYRKSYNQTFNIYNTYPLPAWFYPLKSDLISKLSASHSRKIIIAELQAEIWPNKHPKDVPIDEQVKLFSVNDFKSNIDYAKQTGFEEYILWGVEWWYFMAQNGHPEYLEYGKTLF